MRVEETGGGGDFSISCFRAILKREERPARLWLYGAPTDAPRITTRRAERALDVSCPAGSLTPHSSRHGILNSRRPATAENAARCRRRKSGQSGRFEFPSPPIAHSLPGAIGSRGSCGDPSSPAFWEARSSPSASGCIATVDDGLFPRLPRARFPPALRRDRSRRPRMSTNLANATLYLRLFHARLRTRDARFLAPTAPERGGRTRCRDCRCETCSLEHPFAMRTSRVAMSARSRTN